MSAFQKVQSNQLVISAKENGSLFTIEFPHNSAEYRGGQGSGKKIFKNYWDWVSIMLLTINDGL